MGGQDKKTEKYLTMIKEKERITPGNLAKIFRVSGAAISGWVKKRIKAGMIEWGDENGYHFVDDKALETAKRKGIAYLKISDSYQNETVKGLPTPCDLTGDPRWNEGGDLLELYDLELEKRTALSTMLSGVNPVFTPALNTVKEDEMVNIIEYSGDEPDGVKVLSENPGGEGKNFEKAQEGPANGHGRFSEEELEGMDEPTKALAEEFSVLMNPQNLSKMTPHVCREGCKHYDPIGDPDSGNFREFCGKLNGTLIERGGICENYESKVRLSEMVLTF